MPRKRFVRGGKSVRETSWVFVDPTVTQLAAANTAVIVGISNAALLALRPFTVIRVHGFFGISADQATADESIAAAVGYSVVSDQAGAIGVTAVPTPFTDLGSDLWFVHQIMMARTEFQSGTGVNFNTVRGGAYQSKAMRKVNDDETIAITIETASTSSGLFVHHAARMLIKLH